jgi:hypothetical protein
LGSFSFLLGSNKKSGLDTHSLPTVTGQGKLARPLYKDGLGVSSYDKARPCQLRRPPGAVDEEGRRKPRSTLATHLLAVIFPDQALERKTCPEGGDDCAILA